LYGKFTSHLINVKSGIPQGDRFSPILFLLFINYIISIIKYSNILFADEANFFKIMTSESDELHLQSDLYSFQEWYIDNIMELNIDKRAVISFTYKNINIHFNHTLFHST
jgi:hypothetical protein